MSLRHTLLLCLLLVLPLAAAHPLNSDEGAILDGAWNLHNGRTLYTDFFEFVPPLAFYLPHWLWMLTGPSYVATRLMVVLLLCLSAWGCRLAATAVGGREPAHWPPLLFLTAALLWPTINSNTFATVASVAALVLVLRGVRDRSTGLVAAAGLACGLATLCLQHKGLLLTGALCLALVVDLRWRPSGGVRPATVAWFLLASLVPLALLFVYWDPGTLRRCLVDPLFRYRSVNALPPHLAVAAAVLVGLVTVSLRRERGFGVPCLLLVQAALLATVLQRPDPMHVSNALVPTFCLLPLAHKRSGPRLGFVLRTSVAGLVVVSVLLALLGPSMPAAGREALVTAIRSRCPGPTIFAGPFLPWVYFETRKLNPTRYYMVQTGFFPEPVLQEIADSLRTAPPHCIVWDAGMARKFSYRDDNPVERFIRSSYVEDERVGTLEILRRKEPAGAGAAVTP